jgi:hypothetical protein
VLSPLNRRVSGDLPKPKNRRRTATQKRVLRAVEFPAESSRSGERIRADTPSPSFLISVANIPNRPYHGVSDALTEPRVRVRAGPISRCP